MGVKFSNNGHSTLAASITSSDTSITVASGHGARFPSLGAGDYFYATLIDASNNLEIVKCTARSSDVLTVTRGQESTTARAYAIADRIELRVTAQGITDATDIDTALPSQTSNSGKYLTTDGTNSSWGIVTPYSLPSQTGNSGKFLTTNGTSESWGVVDPAAIVNVGFAQNSTRYALSDSANTAVFTVNYTKIMSATESKIIVIGNIPGRGSYSDFMGMYFDCLTSGISVPNTNDRAAFKGISNGSAPSGSRQGNIIINQTWENTTYLTATTHTFEFGWRTRNGSSGDKPFLQINPNSSDDNRSHQHSSTFTFFEVLR